VTKERVLAAAMELIAERGEAHLRLADVAERAGLSIGAVQHHFRNRERLVAHAQSQRFVEPARADITAIRELFDNAGTADEVQVALEAVTRTVVERGRAVQRMDRLSSLSAAHGRPDVYASMQAEVSRLTEEFADAIRSLQTKGFVRRDVDATAVSVFMQSYALGMVIADLVEPACPDEALANVVDLFMTTLFPDAAT
jgi:AcrR family transcriptional regulator